MSPARTAEPRPARAAAAAVPAEPLPARPAAETAPAEPRPARPAAAAAPAEPRPARAAPTANPPPPGRRDPAAMIAAAVETERLVLRGWQARDRAPFAALNADVWTPRLDAAESDALVDRLEALRARDGFAFMAVERRADGAFLGMVGLQRFPGAGALGPCVEVGWRLAREHWGRGYATEAARAWLDHGFGALGLAEIVAFTNADNAASMAVMRRLGMRRDPARDFVHPKAPELGPLLLHAAAAPA